MQLQIQGSGQGHRTCLLVLSLEDPVSFSAPLSFTRMSCIFFVHLLAFSTFTYAEETDWDILWGCRIRESASSWTFRILWGDLGSRAKRPSPQIPLATNPCTTQQVSPSQHFAGHPVSQWKSRMFHSWDSPSAIFVSLVLSGYSVKSCRIEIIIKRWGCWSEGNSP